MIGTVFIPTVSLNCKKTETDDRLTKEFLLQKDKKENREIAPAQTAHLVFADTKANAEKTKRAIFLPSHEKKQTKDLLKEKK